MTASTADKTGERTKRQADCVTLVLPAEPGSYRQPPLVYRRWDLVGKTVRQAWDTLRHDFTEIAPPLLLNGARVLVKSPKRLKKGDKLTVDP